MAARKSNEAVQCCGCGRRFADLTVIGALGHMAFCAYRTGERHGFMVVQK